MLVAGCLLVWESAQAEVLFVNDATVYTMGSQGMLRGGDLLIRNGRIDAIGTELAPPADATVLEAQRRPVTPGFFAGITALGLTEISAAEATVDDALRAEALRPEFDVRRAYNPRSTLLEVTRIEGFSWTVLGAARAGSIIGGQGQAVLLDGGFDSMLGSELLFVDVGADASGQSWGSRAGQWMLLEQAMKEAGSGMRWLPHPQLTLGGREVLALIRDRGTVVFDVDRASDILQVLAFARRHELYTVVSGGAEAWAVADRIAEAGVAVILNSLENLPVDFDSLGARLDNAARLYEAGVTIAFGGMGSHNARKLRQVAGNAVANGLRYEAALEALTVNPARVFGLGDGAGILQEGSRADLVIWSGDPLEVTTAADQVIIAGALVPMVSRQTRLRDRYLPRDPELPRAYLKP